MAELVDARDSKSRDLTIMRVRFSLAAQVKYIVPGRTPGFLVVVQIDKPAGL